MRDCLILIALCIRHKPWDHILAIADTIMILKRVIVRAIMARGIN